LLERLKAVSGRSVSEFRSQYEKSLRNHAVDFANGGLSEIGFTCLNEALREEAEPHAFQFSVSANEHGRVIGFFVGSVFFVVWLDWGHKLYA
jgi:hypothetical protein